MGAALPARQSVRPLPAPYPNTALPHPRRRSKLALNAKLLFSDLQLPPHTTLREKDPSRPIIKIAK